MPCTRSSARAGPGRPGRSGTHRGPFLQRLEHQHAGGEVDAIGGECQSLREAAAGIGQGHAKRARQPIGALRFAEERIALAGGDVFARAVGVIEPQARGGEGRLVDAGSRAGAAWREREGSALALALMETRLGLREGTGLAGATRARRGP